MMAPIKPAHLLKSIGFCSVDKTLVVSDIAAGTFKLVSGLSDTVSFLKVLGRLYDSFGITLKAPGKQRCLFKML